MEINVKQNDVLHNYAEPLASWLLHVWCNMTGRNELGWLNVPKVCFPWFPVCRQQENVQAWDWLEDFKRHVFLMLLQLEVGMRRKCHIILCTTHNLLLYIITPSLKQAQHSISKFCVNKVFILQSFNCTRQHVGTCTCTIERTAYFACAPKYSCILFVRCVARSNCTWHLSR